MKTTKKFPALLALAMCLAFLAFSANAQKRKSSTSKRASKPAAEARTSAGGELKAAAAKVSTQLKNLTRFLYGFGNVAQVIEDLERDIKAGKASRNAPDLNQKNKRAVLTTIRDFRAGLAALEVEFRTKPALKNYLFQINGITDLSGNAEDQAASGQFIEAGKTLVLAVDKLVDTLAALP